MLAGGCVRDMLLDRVAKDFDVATNATPQEVIRLFSRTLKVGAKFGVVIVLTDDVQVEVATFRTETGYVDGRHPDAVRFASAKEDASRRDFTINGMFYDPVTNEVIDYVGGQDDLKKKIVRTIGNPEERFSEDYLRMLRAVRFSAQLGFEIESRTWEAIRGQAENIKKISGERIAMELEGILTAMNHSKGAEMLLKSGLAGAIFPGFEGQAAEFGIKVLGKLKGSINPALGLAGFFAGYDTNFTMEKCRILKLSRNRLKHIKFLLGNRAALLDETMSLAKLKKILAEPYFEDLLELEGAIQKVKPDGKKGKSALAGLKKRIKTLGCVELRPKPLLDGHALIRLGAAPGPAVGRLADEMYTAQLEGDLKTPEQAEQWVRNCLKKQQ